MKNLTKKTITTLILLVVTTVTVWAGDVQCPVSAVPCLADTTTIENNPDADDVSQDSNDFGDIFSLIFENINLIF